MATTGTSVATNGLYMHTEMSEINNRKLEQFGVKLNPSCTPESTVSRQPTLTMKKVKKLRNIGSREFNCQSSDRVLNYRKLLFDNAAAVASDSVIKEESTPEEISGHYEPLVSNTTLTTGADPSCAVINVSGTQFIVDLALFSTYPDTLLGSDRISEFYSAARHEYFLERQKHVFGSVMRFYTNDGELVCPPCIPKSVFEGELEFYGLTPYYNMAHASSATDLRHYKAKTRREEVLLHIEFPGYSKCATAYAVFDLIMIVISTVILVLESVPKLQGDAHFLKICTIVEMAVNVYFTLQTLILISVYPTIRLYFSSLTNWIDVISVMPFYLKIIAKEYLNQVGGFRVLRLIRLLRILKLFRHSPGSQTMIQFLITSIPEIVLLLLMWSIGVLMFGPLLYFVEQDHGDNFNSAFSGMWFCVVTIGTVGYGDTVPKTEFGKILAACYAIINLTIMTIPISIIITKFNKSMKKSGTSSN